MNISKPWMKVVFIIVLLLIILPLVLFALIQVAPPVKEEPGTVDNSDSGSTTTIRERRARRETRAVRQETTVWETEPVQDFEGVGAVVPNAPRSKQATPYPPGTVPGDSGVIVQYAGSPDDMASGPVPPPQDDF